VSGLAVDQVCFSLEATNKLNHNHSSEVILRLGDIFFASTKKSQNNLYIDYATPMLKTLLD